MHFKNTSSIQEVKNKSAGMAATKSGSSILGLFSSQISLQEGELNKYDQDICELRKEIEAAGDKLVQEPTLPNFKHFREVLSKLAKRISSEAYRLDKFGGTPQNPRYYEIITVINSEADRLYELIVKQQKDNMAITAKVIGIKGLVVDLIT